MADRTEDYAIVGDMQSVALLSTDVGFLEADDPRVVSTMKVLQRDLMQTDC